MTPLALMATKAATICCSMERIRAAGLFLLLRMKFARSPPSQYSIMICSYSFS